MGRGVTVLTAQDVHASDAGTPSRNAIRAVVAGDAPAYLSFDVDALDPAFAPGTGTPEIGGLATWQVQAILRRLRGVAFAGMDVVEVAPAYDVAEITALAAATVVWEYLALLGAASHVDWSLRRTPKTHNTSPPIDPYMPRSRSGPGAISMGAAALDASHVPRARRRAQQRRNASFSVGPVQCVGPGSQGNRLCWLISWPRCEVLAASAEFPAAAAHSARGVGCSPRFLS